MFHFLDLSAEEFKKIARIPNPEERASIRSRICELVEVSANEQEAVVSALLYAKTTLLIKDIWTAPDFSVSGTLADAGFSWTKQVTIFESQFGGFDSFFFGSRKTWFENLLDFIGGAEDVVMISEDFMSIMVLTHYRQLRFGELTQPGFRDPFWVEFASRAAKRVVATNLAKKEILGRRSDMNQT